MEYQQLIDAANQAIGQGAADDYVIAPTRHAESLAATAPALARVLRRSELSSTASQYERKDGEAGKAQMAFKAAANRANWAVFVAACLSAVLLVAGLVTGNGAGKVLLIVVGSCGVVAGSLGSMWVFKVRSGNLLKNWMASRAAAETLRLKYFDLVIRAEDKGESPTVPLPLLQLEYFRRYQLDVQLVYFKNRGADHKRAADKMLSVSALAVGLGSLATGLGGLLGFALGSKWVAIAGLGAITTAVSAFTATKEGVSQDRRNEERYGKTLDALEEIAGRLDAVRNAAAVGEREPVQQFVAAVHDQLSLEHRQWLGAAESTQASLSKLEETLASVQSKLAKPQAAEHEPPAQGAGSSSDPTSRR